MSAETVQQAIDAVRAGRVVILPTDTAYRLAAAPERCLALRKQFSVLSCYLSVKSRFWPDNEQTTEPAEIVVAPIVDRALSHFALAAPVIAARVQASPVSQRAAAGIAEGHPEEKR